MYSSRRRAAPVTALAVLCSLLVTAAPTAAGAATEPASAWRRPVDGAVVRRFQEPTSVYGPGHRGVDFGAVAGTPVRAANDGVVSFAGSVAGSLHVTVTHEGGIKTSYSFLQSVSVQVGQRVARGDLVGTAGGQGTDHDSDVLHFGVRVGDRYVDPMLLFRPDDLTKLVHLVPADVPEEQAWTSAGERRALETSLHLVVPGNAAEPSADRDHCGGDIPFVGDVVGVVCDVGVWLGDRAGEAIGAGLHYLDAVTNTASSVLESLRDPLEDMAQRLREVPAQIAASLARTPMGTLVLDVVAMGRRFVDAAFAECTDDAPEADGSGGSTHRVMVVAGIDSSGAAGDRGS